jgi:hypothetical protein
VGWDLRHQVLRPLLAFCTAPDDRWGWLWSNWWNEPKYSEKTCPSAILSTTNPTWPDPCANTGRRGGKSATNRLSYGAAFFCNYSSTKLCSYEVQMFSRCITLYFKPINPLVFIFMIYRYLFIFINLIKVHILHEIKKENIFLVFCTLNCNHSLKCNIYFHLAYILLQLVSHDLYTHRTDIIPFTSVIYLMQNLQNTIEK